MARLSTTSKSTAASPTAPGNALLEEIIYDASGRMVTHTLTDYALPRASDVPSLEVHHVVTPSSLNPLGVKGSGEDARARMAPGAADPR